jgi:hypothetical protein
MRTKFILSALFAILLIASSCEKQDNNPFSSTKYQVAGLWIGTYTVDNDKTAPGVYFYSYAVYPDGSILIKGLGADGNYYYSTGNWQLSGANLFTATITTLIFNGPPVTQTITANYSDNGKMTDGVWADIKNGVQKGKLSTMQRVN